MLSLVQFGILLRQLLQLREMTLIGRAALLIVNGDCLVFRAGAAQVLLCGYRRCSVESKIAWTLGVKALSDRLSQRPPRHSNKVNSDRTCLVAQPE